MSAWNGKPHWAAQRDSQDEARLRRERRIREERSNPLSCPGCGSVEKRWAHPLNGALWAECRQCGLRHRLDNGATDNDLS